LAGTRGCRLVASAEMTGAPTCPAPASGPLASGLQLRSSITDFCTQKAARDLFKTCNPGGSQGYFNGCVAGIVLRNMHGLAL